jgi:hypothetical protein
MVTIGNHIKMTVSSVLKARTRDFYGGLLGLKSLPSPAENLDLYEFRDGFVLGLFFSADQAEVLTERDYLKASWLELKVDDLAWWKDRLQRFGVTEIEYDDPSRFAEPYPRYFFQAPGGQVFRLAPLQVSNIPAPDRSR